MTTQLKVVFTQNDLKLSRKLFRENMRTMSGGCPTQYAKLIRTTATELYEIHLTKAIAEALIKRTDVRNKGDLENLSDGMEDVETSIFSDIIDSDVSDDSDFNYELTRDLYRLTKSFSNIEIYHIDLINEIIDSVIGCELNSITSIDVNVGTKVITLVGK